MIVFALAVFKSVFLYNFILFSYLILLGIKWSIIQASRGCYGWWTF